MSIQIDIPLLLWLVFILLGYGACAAGIRSVWRRDQLVRGGRP